MAITTTARARALSLTLALISIVSALFIAEVMVRVFAPQPIGNALPMYEPDTLKGHRLKPGYSGRLKTGEFNVPIRINTHGYRGEDWRLDMPRRILILGDSFTFGYGVEERNTFPVIVERRLKRDGCDIAVFNAGVPGYGTVQEYTVLGELFDSVRPDIVIVAYTAGSDLRDNVEFLLRPENGLEVRDGYLVKKTLPPGTRIGIKAFLQERSHLYVLLQRTKAILAMGDTDHLVPRPCDHFLARSPCGDTYAGWSETGRLLKRMAEFCCDNGSLFMILAIPHPVQSDEDLWKGEIRRAEDSGDSWERFAVQDRLSALASAIGCRFIDPLHRFQSESENQLYFPIDRHITRNGHELIAEELLQSIKDIIEWNNYNDG